MFHTDTGNFNRFLTSLGLLLLAASLVIPYFYFQNTDVLEIPQRDLNRLTDTGRSALTARQDAIASLESWVVGVAICAAILGVVFIVLGGLRLRSAQASDDEETEIRMRQARLDLEKKELSSDEQAARLATQVKEAEAAERQEEAPAEPPPAPQEQEAQPARPLPTVGEEGDAAPWRMQGWRDAITRIWKEVEDAFASRDIDSHRLKTQLKIKSTNGSIDVDGLFESLDRNYDNVLLETKVVMNAHSLRKTARNVATQFVRMLAHYQMITEERASGWLVVIVSAESEADLDSDLAEEVTAALREVVGEIGRVTLTRESEIDSLPDLFTREFVAT